MKAPSVVAMLGALVYAIAGVRVLRWSRGSGGAASVLHRAHTWVIVVAFAVVIAGVASAARSESLLFIAPPLDAVVWGVLFVLTAGLLGVYAMQPSL